MYAQEVNRMSVQAQTAMSAVTVTTLGASNLIAWASSFDAAAVAGTITILGLAGIGIITRAIKEISKSRSEAWADRVRLEMQIQADQEKLNAGSLTGQIKDLTKLVTELKDDNARVKADLAESDADRKERDDHHIEREAFLLERVNDANSKAHEIRNKLSTDILARDVKIQELEAARDAKFHEFEEEIKRLRLEIERLSALLAERADSQDKRIDDNAAAIQTLSEQRAGDAA